MNPTKVMAPCNGSLFRLKMVHEVIFASKLTGDGVAIRAEDTHFYAMCDGVVKAVFKSNNCVVIETQDKLQLMLYVGLNTLKLNAIGIECFVRMNQQVKQNDLLIRVNSDKKVDLTTMVIVMNPEVLDSLQVNRQGRCRVNETEILSYKTSIG